MVNTGKPSGGCKLCRARRIKCDETKPACLKCLRSKRQCPGYRDPFEGRFRDETQATIRKFKRTRIVIEKDEVLGEEGARRPPCRRYEDEDEDARADGVADWSPTTEREEEEDVRADVERWTSGYFCRRRRSASASASASATTPSESAWSAAAGASPPAPDWIHEDYLTTLATPVEQQATCYLLADYVLVSDSPGGRRGYFKFAYRILTRAERPSRCLLSAFKAVAFVALASRPGASRLVTAAEGEYSKALREVNRAIQDPKQVRRDDTLAAVLLLAFYETLSSTRERLDEYISHIKGAAQLVKMRGPRQTDTDEGAEMFSMTRNQLLAARSMAPDLGGGAEGEDYAWLLRQSCPDAYVSRVATLTIACCEVRMKADRALAGGARDPARVRAVLDLLRAAQALSRKLSGLDQPQSAVWRVRRGGRRRRGQDPWGGEEWGGGEAAWEGEGEGEEYEYEDEDDDVVDSEGAWAPSDVYSFHNLYVCMIYNIVWTSHLFLTTCIFRCMAWLAGPGSGAGGDEDDDDDDDWRRGAEYELAARETRRRVGDIVASMAYACSWNGYRDEYAGFACGSPGPGSAAKGVAGMCVFRPAFTAMMSDHATPEQKAYLRGRLRFLADVVGIKQVNVLLKLQDQASHPSKDIERDRIRGLY